MPNQETCKVPVDRKRFDEALKLRNSNIKKLGEVREIDRSAKTIRRCLKEEKMTPDLLARIGKYLDVDPAYISGEYDREADMIKNTYLREISKARLKAEKFPYLVKQQGQVDLYDKYFENILIIHDISMRQFQALPFEQQKQLQMDIENAITRVIAKHFDHDAKGRKGLPDLDSLWAAINNYDADEPDLMDDIDIGPDDEDLFVDKYSDYIEGGSNNAN